MGFLKFMSSSEKRQNSEGGSSPPFSLEKSKITVKDAIYIGGFFVTAAVSVGAALQSEQASYRELSALKLRVDKQEDTLNSLIRELTKVSRDTEWIRDYLKDNKRNP